jgi:C1A family cysteine protease
MSKYKQVGVGLFLSITTLLSLNAFAENTINSASQLQQIINAKNAGWVAKDNWVTRLPRAQIQRMLGLQQKPDLNAQFMAPSSTLSTQSHLDGSVDWRNKDGVNWVSPVLNQGNCGSCVAFSTVATLETQYNITSGIPGLNPQFSTQALFACGGGACDFGWQPSLSAQYLKNTGVPDEACAPYTSGATGQDVDCSNICSDHSARTLKIADFTTPSTGTLDINSVKAALANGPLTTTLMVYDDFLFYSGGIYKHVSGGAAGGHAVSIVGYDDATRVWIVRNSWGPDWGENGFIRVSWDDTSGVSNETWQYVLPKADGYVGLENPRNRDTLSGLSHLVAQATFPNTTKVDVNLTDTSGRAALTLSCIPQDRACNLDVDTSTLKDGKYDAVAVAHVGGDVRLESSQHAVFNVLNSVPSMSLSFSGGVGENGQPADLTKPLSDRVVFNVNAVSSPVPFSSITFHVLQNGKEVYTKNANIVVPGMTLGWRTGSVANGAYEIYFTGAIAPQGKPAFTTESSHLKVTVANAPSTLAAN